jgi:hypothetical protein
MAEDRRAGAAALGISIPAAILAALALSKKTQAAPGPGGGLTLPKEFIDLIIAIAASTDNINGNIRQIIQALNALSINVQGWPANADSLAALRVGILVAGTQLPDISVPSGMSLVIKAWALNPGWLQVGASLAECTQINQSFPLLPSEIVAYQVKNANQIWVAANAAGCFACLTVEKRKGGGE